MTTLQINIPDELASKVFKITTDAESYIIDLLQTNVNEIDPTLTLAHEYKLASIENTGVLEVYATLDLENWNDDY